MFDIVSVSFLALALSIGFPVDSACSETKADVVSVTKQIRTILQTQAQAWNRGDIDTFMAYYWKSKQLSFSSGGKTIRGWQATLDRYKKRYPTQDKMGHLSFSQIEITPLGSSSALVLGRWYLRRKEDAPQGNFSLVLRKIDGNWRIVHDHTSRTPVADD